MRELAVYDFKNYKENGMVGRRPSVRGVIIRDGKIAMIHSLKYDYYKFPGGGIDGDESHIETLIREVEEEAGLVVIKETVSEYGVVIRKEKGNIDDIFIQENFYYFCDVEEEIRNQRLDEYEAEEEFVLEWVEPVHAIEANTKRACSESDDLIAKHRTERETNVLKLLVDEKYFD